MPVVKCTWAAVMTDWAAEANAATTPSLARQLHMPMRTANQIKVSQAEAFSRQPCHVSTPVAKREESATMAATTAGKPSLSPNTHIPTATWWYVMRSWGESQPLRYMPGNIIWGRFMWEASN